MLWRLSGQNGAMIVEGATSVNGVLRLNLRVIWNLQLFIAQEDRLLQQTNGLSENIFLEEMITDEKKKNNKKKKAKSMKGKDNKKIKFINVDNLGQD